MASGSDDERTVIGPRAPQTDDRTVIGPRAPQSDERTVIGPRAPQSDDRTIIGPRGSQGDDHTIIGPRAFGGASDAATQIAPRVLSNGPSPPRKRRSFLLIGGAAAATLVVGAAIFAFLLPSRLTEPALRAALAAASSGYQCASIQYDTGADRSVRLTGHVPTAADLDRLRAAVGGIRGVGSIRSEVGVMPWPHCEVANALVPLLAWTGQAGPGLAFDAGAAEPHIGDRLAVDVRMPDFDGYVNVDYFTSDGQVLHLLPNQRDLLSMRPAYNRFVLFKPPLHSCWAYSGAAGRQLIALVVTPRPLFAAPRNEIETARDYLPALTQALANAPQGTGAAAMLFVDLRAAQPGAKPDACPSG